MTSIKGNTGDSAVTMGRYATYCNHHFRLLIVFQCRIAWADAHARKVTNDSFTFYDVILHPLLNDLLNSTWMWERFTCEVGFIRFFAPVLPITLFNSKATPTHNPFYHEYPETVAMLIREIAYGISIEFDTVTIAPMALPTNGSLSHSNYESVTLMIYAFLAQATWHYEMGIVDISYSQHQVFILIPFVSYTDKVNTIEPIRERTSVLKETFYTNRHS